MTFSLDSLDPVNFHKMTGRNGLEEVFESIQLAKRLSFEPIKVNAVVIRDMNDHELEALVEFGRSQGIVMRFIEFMPLDAGKAWQKEKWYRVMKCSRNCAAVLIWLPCLRNTQPRRPRDGGMQMVVAR